MENMQYCDFCHKPFTENEKSFFPVNSNVAYHWKCYIQKVKEKGIPIFSWEEEYEEKFVEI